jgi:hypothetical protein
MIVRCPAGHELEIMDPDPNNLVVDAVDEPQEVHYTDNEGVERMVIAPGSRVVGRYNIIKCPDCSTVDKEVTFRIDHNIDGSVA